MKLHATWTKLHSAFVKTFMAATRSVLFICAFSVLIFVRFVYDKPSSWHDCVPSSYIFSWNGVRQCPGSTKRIPGDRKTKRSHYYCYIITGRGGRRSDTTPVYPVFYTASGWSFRSGEDLRYREEFQIPPKQTEHQKCGWMWMQSKRPRMCSRPPNWEISD